MPLPVIGIAEAGMRGANEVIIAELGIGPPIASIKRLPLSGTDLAEGQANA